MSATETTRTTNNLKGGVFVLAAGLGFTVTAIGVKHFAHDYSAPLQNFYRQIVGICLLMPYMVRLGRGIFETDRPGLLLYRGAAVTMATTLMLYGFQTMPIANANALSFTRSLWIAPLAILLLGEKFDVVKIGAMFIGFCGVLVILRPGSDLLGPALPTAAMLLSAMLYGSTSISLRLMGRGTAPGVVLVWASILGTLFAIPGALATWRWPNASDLILLIVLGGVSTGSQALLIRGLAIGEAMLMATLDYTRIIFGALGGYLFFAEVPGVSTWIGALIIIASGLAVAWREHRASRTTVPAALPENAALSAQLPERST